MTVGKRLMSARGGRTRAEVASAVGLSVSAISMYENDFRVPKDDVKEKLAQYFGVSIQELFFTEAAANKEAETKQMNDLGRNATVAQIIAARATWADKPKFIIVDGGKVYLEYQQIPPDVIYRQILSMEPVCYGMRGSVKDGITDLFVIIVKPKEEQAQCQK